jgi:scyllo-inositol 2-dehydrogenase (NADP+)
VTIGVGLVGYGMSGSSLHAPLIGAEPELELRAVVSDDPEPVHRDLPSVRFEPTLERLLDDTSVELVVVAAPNAVHHELTRAALLADRHVVVDKPFTISTADAEDLIRTAAERDRRLAVFHQRRWDSDHLTVRRCVETGLLGRVTTYLARWERFLPGPATRWTEQDGPGAGVLYDLGAHLIDQVVSLFGTPETVWADLQVQRPGGATVDYAHLVLGYGPMRAVLHITSLVRTRGPRFEVHGDGGSLVAHGMDGQIAALLAGRRPGDPGWGDEAEGQSATLTTELGGLTATARLTSALGAYESFYREMADAVRGRGPVPVPAEQACETIRVIEYAERSSRDGCTVPFP